MVGLDFKFLGKFTLFRVFIEAFSSVNQGLEWVLQVTQNEVWHTFTYTCLPFNQVFVQTKSNKVFLCSQL